MKWTTDEFTGKRFGKYEALCRLAVGGMAEIFLGFARSGPFLGRPVVIKRVLNEQREDPNTLQMLLNEARLTATLSHPNIAQIVDLEVDDEEVLLVIEFITGANLEELSEANLAHSEPLPLGFAISVIREAAQGLGNAHGHKDARGQPLPVVHRDVTPRNVMVDFSGNTKMLDFGIARAKGSERRTQAGMVRGTTAYMSPEQAIGKDPDPRSDLFSLGTIFHELLTGRRLFYKGNPALEMAAVYEGEIPLPSQVNKRIPPKLDAVVMRMLERKLDRRFQSAPDLIRELNAAAGTVAWPREKCAELVRTRFAARQKEIEALVARIPQRREVDSNASTLMTRGPVSASALNDEESSARTLVGAQPLPPTRRPTAPTQPEREAATDPFKQPLLRPTDDTSKGLSADELFEDDAPQPTRIIAGASIRNIPRAVSDAPTDPRRAPVARPGSGQQPQRSSSKLPLIIAALLALVIGGGGGAMLLKTLRKDPVPTTVVTPPPVATPKRTMMKLSVSSDRPATVFLGEMELGETPFSAVVPVGQHRLEFTEDAGTRRMIDVELSGDEAEKRLSVTLDSLAPVP